MADRAPNRRRWILGVGASLLTAGGCGEELGPVSMPTARVAGRLHYGGRPIGSGWVEFHPIDGTVGKIRSARLRPDGRFEADRVAIGTNILLLVNPPSELGPGGVPTYGILGYFTRYPIVSREVGPDGSTGMEIDLRAEYLKFRRTHPVG